MEKLKNRHIKEILYLLSLQYPISTSKISEETGISKSTLKKDLSLISTFLKPKKLILVRKPKVGIFLKGEVGDKDNLRRELSLLHKKVILDKEGRVTQLILDCLTNDRIPTIEDWCDKFETSRPTIVDDLKHVKAWLKKENLILKGKPGVGYKLIGGEEEIRNAMVKLIIQGDMKDSKGLLAWMLSGKVERFKNLSSNMITRLDPLQIKQFLSNIELQTSTKLVDRDFLVLALKIAVSIERIKNKYYLIMDAKRLFNIMHNPMYKTIYENTPALEKFYNIKFSPEEIAYITLSFISSKVQGISLLVNNNGKRYKSYAQKIGEIANNIFGLPISNDKEFIHMLELHLKATLNKIKYGIRIDNPLLNEIKEEYPLSFNIAERAAIILGKKLHIKIPETEAGYIAMYIAITIERLKHQKRKRKKVAVICAMAIGTSSLLFWRLLNEMPDIDVIQVGSYKDIVEGKIDPDIDLIISTIPLPEMEIPHIVVSPFLSTKERKTIREKLGIAKYKWKYPSATKIGEILDTKIIFANVEVEKAQDIIRLLGEALVKNGYTKKNFVKATLQREKKFPTGLDTPIAMALPHVDASFTLRKGFAIATLKKPIIFNQMGEPNKKIGVRIVVIPVLTPKSEDNTTFYELLRKCRDGKTAHKLLGCYTPKEIKEVLTKSFVS